MTITYITRFYAYPTTVKGKANDAFLHSRGDVVVWTAIDFVIKYKGQRP